MNRGRESAECAKQGNVMNVSEDEAVGDEQVPYSDNTLGFNVWMHPLVWYQILTMPVPNVTGRPAGQWIIGHTVTLRAPPTSSHK